MIMICCAMPFRVFAQDSTRLERNRAKLRAQNELMRQYGLERMKDANTIDSLTKTGDLVRIPSRGTGWYLDSRLGSGYRYPEKLRRARRWVRLFLEVEGSRFRKQFRRSSWKVTSLVRTEYRQQQLLRRLPGVAASCKRDDECSPHLSGSALDISKKGMARARIRWISDRLDSLERCGWVNYIEERAAFHIFVTPLYGKGTCQ